MKKKVSRTLFLSKINLYSFSTFFYFFAVLCNAVSDDTIVKLIYYLSIALCLLCVIKKRLILDPICSLMGLIILVLASLNHIFIHNIPILNIIILLSSTYMAFMFLQAETKPRAFLAAFYCNIIYVIISTILHGMRYEFYLESSSNYISIYLIAPISLYYTALDRDKREPPLIHCLVLWIVCFIAGSRMGFATASILFVYVFFYKFLEKKRKPIEKALFIIVMSIISVMTIAYLLPAFVSRFSNARVIERFINLGTSGEGRIYCWEEYLESLSNRTYLFLGSDLSKLQWVIHYQGNLHNAYLFVHAYLGLFGILGLFSLLMYGMYWGIKRRHLLYFSCLIMFCTRGITDHMFGANRISVILIALLVYPIIENRKDHLRARFHCTNLWL